MAQGRIWAAHFPRKREKGRFFLLLAYPLRLWYNTYNTCKEVIQMAAVRPITDLRDRFDDITQTARESDEAILLSQDGEEDLILMSRNVFEEMMFRLELDLKLQEAEHMEKVTDVRYSWEEIFNEAQKIIRGVKA